MSRETPGLQAPRLRGRRSHRPPGWFRALAEAFEVDDAPHPAVDAAIRHALDFQTWHSLTGRGLSDAEARDAMTSYVTLMAGRPTAV